MSAFKHDDFVNLLKPKDFIESIAVRKMEGLSWVDAHLLAARTYLLNDDIKDYMRHIDVLQYQFPLLGDFNSIVSYFYYRKKLNLDDYTAKRVGIIQLYRGEFNEAIKYLSEAYKADPKDTLVLYNLSLAHVKKKEYKTALSTIEKCLALNPKYSEAKDLKQQIQIELKK
jgi:tetratricopeptide (TPR) repeat protein